MLDRLDLDIDGSGRTEYGVQYLWAVAFSGILALVLVGRFFQLQVVKGGEYERLAQINYISDERVPARRGVIKDRQGRVVARNIDAHHLTITPHYLKEPEKTLPLLRELLGLTNTEYASLQQRIEEGSVKEKRFNPISVARDLVAGSCPFDSAELKLVDEVPHLWCPECGGVWHELPAGAQKCPNDKRPLKPGGAGHALHCSACGSSWLPPGEHAARCPVDGATLERPTTNLQCPMCKRRFNSEQAIITANLHRLPGVRLVTEMRREYPYRYRLSHVLGYMNEVNREDMEKWPGAYRPGDWIGRTGIERAMEEALRGQSGEEVSVRDSRGASQDPELLKKLFRGLGGTKAVPGQTVVLTLDVELQGIIKDAMRYHRSGAVVVMEAATGEVLALYSKPSFDPNIWSGRLTREAKREVDENPYGPLYDKALTAYAPGSIFKVVTSLAALDTGVVAPSWHTTCPGFYTFGGRRFRCHARGGHGGDIALEEALMLSCDVYYYQVGELMGMDVLSRYSHEVFRLGEPTGIELNERVGRVPTKEWHRQQPLGWQPGFTLSVSVGQGSLLTTPLQMARVYAAIANGGKVMRARIVKRLEDAGGNVTRTFQPEVERTLPFSEQHLAAVRRGLERVVNDPDRGTARSARLENVIFAGKTGTAEAPQSRKGASEEVAEWLKQDHAWFAAYAPIEDPQIVVVVFVEHGGSGGQMAAPVAQHVIDQYFRRGLGKVVPRAGSHDARRAGAGADAPSAAPDAAPARRDVPRPMGEEELP